MRNVVASIFAPALIAALAACSVTERTFTATGGSGGGGGAATSTSSTGTTTSSTSSSSSGTTSSSSGTGGGPMTCVNNGECNDDDACTTDTCAAGHCVNTPVNIDDDDACTVDTCDKVTGVDHAMLPIDDSDPCTADACDPVTGPSHTPISDPTKWVFTELRIGNPDYMVLTNTSTCPNDVAGLQLLWDSATGADVTTMLPTQVVPPMGTVEITDASNPPAPKIYAGAPVGFDPSSGGAALLCNGPCNAAANVIDAVTFSIAAAAPALPTGVTFSPRPLRGITSVNQNAASFHRAAFGGASPNFLASDWQAGEPCDLKNLRLVELNVGTPDYVVIHNPTICKLDLNGLQIVFDDSGLGDVTFTLPAQLLGAGATVRVIEGAQPGDINIANIPFSATRGGNVLLCNGDCNVAANVIDALSWDGGAPHSALPAGVTFGPTAVTGITQTDESTRSFVRVAQSGVAPAFVRSDWAVGPLCTDPTRLRFSELNVGNNDYVRIENPSYCPIKLDGLQILFDDSSSGDSTAILPSQLLPALSGVYVKEASQVMPGDINGGTNIPYSSTRGGAAILCNGACVATSGTNVIDVVAFSTGAPFPTLPMGVTFSSGLLGIDQATENTLSWLRGNYKGANPTFIASDWFVGPAGL